MVSKLLDTTDKAAIPAKRKPRSPAVIRSRQNTEITGSVLPHALYRQDEQTLPIPIFLHSSFRTSSTWIWTKFREIPNVLAYYEIFNEILVHLEAKSINNSTYSSWDSRHTPQAPYFLEYLPLLKQGGGVVGFEASMALDRFIPEGGLNGTLSFEEQAYLNILVEHAYRGRQIPVLSCTRSIGRMAAIKRFMPSKNVLLYRNIFDQWSSYSGQFLRGNPFFFETIGKTAASFQNDAFLRTLRDAFSGNSASPKDDQTFMLFILMHIYLYAHALESADLIIDTTAVAIDRDLQHSVKDELSKLVFANIDLSDAKPSFDASTIVVRDRRQFVDTIEQFVKIIASTCPTERSATFAFKLKNDTLARWDVYDTLTRNSISWYERQNSDLQQKINDQSFSYIATETAMQTIASDRDSMSANLAKLDAERTAAESATADVAIERDTIAAALAEITAAHAALQGVVAGLQGERDHLAAALAGAEAARCAAEAMSATADATAATLRVECEAITKSLAEGIADRSAIENACAALQTERDSLSNSLAKVTSEQEIANETIAALRTERDGVAAEARDAAAAFAAERDHIVASLAELQTALYVAEEAVASLTAERDGVKADLTAARAAHAALAIEHHRTTEILATATSKEAVAQEAMATLGIEHDCLALSSSEAYSVREVAEDSLQSDHGGVVAADSDSNDVPQIDS